MDRLGALGVAVTLFALAGYVLGIWIEYPGRAFTIAAFMAGATLAVVGGAESGTHR